MTNRKRYTYEGPVMEFDRCIVDRWSASTYASTPGRAKSNLIYRFKISNNRTPNTKITLPGEIVEA